jgi:hypothetical protein
MAHKRPKTFETSVKFASQICHESINKTLDGAYLADFGIDISIRRRHSATRRKLQMHLFVKDTI